nr:hypothetical protein [Tanacetum cinerariifolium]
RQALGFQNPRYLKKAQQLKPNLYNGSVIGKSDVIVVPDSKNTLMHAEEIQTDEPTHSGTTIFEVPKELPKVSMGFEHTKACFRDDIIPFVKNLKDLFTSFDQYLIDERDNVSSSESAPTFAELFKTNELKAQIQEKDTSVEVADLNASLQEKVLVITALKEQLKGKAVLPKAVSLNPIDPALLQVDVVPLIPKLRKNRTTHIDYIKHTLEEATILRELVESERLLSPLNTPLAYACKYTRRIQELLMIL